MDAVEPRNHTSVLERLTKLESGNHSLHIQTQDLRAAVMHLAHELGVEVLDTPAMKADPRF